MVIKKTKYATFGDKFSEHFRDLDQKFKDIFGTQEKTTLFMYGNFVQMSHLGYLQNKQKEDITFDSKVDRFMEYLRRGAIGICKTNRPRS